MLLSVALASIALRAPGPLIHSHARAAAPAMLGYSVDQPIDVGQPLPNVEVETMEDNGRGLGEMKPISEVLGSGKAILLGMPGAFTPTCNDVHLPGFYKAAPDLKAMGVDKIALVTTNDRFVNAQWQKSMCECMGVAEGQAPVVMLSDARGDLAESLGLIGYLGRALGVRSKRFALVVENNVVKYKAVDEGSEVLDATSADEILKFLSSNGGSVAGINTDGLLLPGIALGLLLLLVAAISG